MIINHDDKSYDSIFGEKSIFSPSRSLMYVPAGKLVEQASVDYEHTDKMDSNLKSGAHDSDVNNEQTDSIPANGEGWEKSSEERLAWWQENWPERRLLCKVQGRRPARWML